MIVIQENVRSKRYMKIKIYRYTFCVYCKKEIHEECYLYPLNTIPYHFCSENCLIFWRLDGKR